MTIYLDVIFLENLCMNYIILYATAIITKTKPKMFRIVLGSLIGAIYAVIVVMKILEIYSNVIFKIIVSIAIVYVSLETKNVKMLIKDILIFYLTSFTFGGVALALLYFIKPENILMKNGVYIGTYPIKIALMGGILGFIIITLAFSIIKKRINKKSIYCNIEVCINGKITEVKALLDTGNFLKEPITGAPVVIIESVALREILPIDLLNNIKPIIDGKQEIDSKIDELLPKLRVIPFSSLGKQNGMLLGIKADYLTVITTEEKCKISNVVIGIYEGSLTKDGAYNSLISLELLERSEEKHAFA